MARKKKTERSTFSKIFEQLLEEKNLSLSTVSSKTGVPRTTLQYWVTGNNPEDYTAVKRLAEFLNVSLSFLLTGSEEKTKESPTSLAEMFEHGSTFDGVVQIKLTHLIPRDDKRKEKGESNESS